jgi:hypothetical protein
MLRQFVAKVQKECTGMGPKRDTVDWGALATDPKVLNAKVACKTVPGLNMAVQLPAMRAEPSGEKVGTPYRVGKSTEKEPFPIEEVRVPSFLTGEPGAMDVCVRTGHPDEADFTEVCAAFKSP